MTTKKVIDIGETYPSDFYFVEKKNLPFISALQHGKGSRILLSIKILTIYSAINNNLFYLVKIVYRQLKNNN